MRHKAILKYSDDGRLNVHDGDGNLRGYIIVGSAADHDCMVGKPLPPSERVGWVPFQESGKRINIPVPDGIDEGLWLNQFNEASLGDAIDAVLSRS